MQQVAVAIGAAVLPREILINTCRARIITLGFERGRPVERWRRAAPFGKARAADQGPGCEEEKREAQHPGGGEHRLNGLSLAGRMPA